MIAKTLSFSSPGQLSVKNDQLVYDGCDGVHRTFPVEDLGFVIVETGRMEVSSSCLQRLADSNVALVICDAVHMPCAQMLPFAAHSTAQETMTAQFAASDAVQGRLWRQIIQRKISNQALLLKQLGHAGESFCLNDMAKSVKNHDAGNIEAQAARIYFRGLAPSQDFRRDRDGAWPNDALNYGYAILRAAMARSLVGSGLFCFRGIHHHNRYNAFALADDMMEPYRPFVDQYVLGGEPPFDVPATELTREMRSKLLEMLTCDVRIGGVKRPLSIALTFTTASLARHYLGKADKLALPDFA